MHPGKDVYTVESHHHALLPWSIIRSRSNSAPNLISLDHHTDAHPAFLRYVHSQNPQSEESDPQNQSLRAQFIEEINWREKQTVRSAIDRLFHDEHIQTATLSGIIHYAFVIQLIDFDGTPSIEEISYDREHPYSPLLQRAVAPRPTRPFNWTPPESRVFIVPHECFIGCAKTTHDDECNVIHCTQVLESSYLSDQMGWAQEMASCVGMPELEKCPYILDIDLDYFHTSKAYAPDNPATFHRLIQNALAISIAKEEGCTSNLWIGTESVEVATVLDRVYGHIDAACSD
jgi:hypothetical protein